MLAGLALAARVVWAEQSHDTLTVVKAFADMRVPRVAFNGTDYLVAWHDHRRNGFYGNPWGARVSTSGVVLENAHELLNGLGRETNPDFLAFDGTHYLVGSSDDSLGQELVRLSPSAAVIDDPPYVYAFNPDGPARFAMNSSSALLLFGSDHFERPSIYVGHLADAGTLVVPNMGSTPYGTGVANDIQFVNGYGLAASQSDFLSVWSTIDAGVEGVFARFLDLNGSPTGAPFSVGATGNAQTAPAVASDGQSYLVLWADGQVSARSLRAAHVTQTTVSPSTVLGGLQNFGDNTGFDVAFNGVDYVVVWSATRNTLLGALIDVDGGVQSMQTLDSNTDDAPEPGVGSSGTTAGQSLVTWLDAENCVVGSRFTGLTRLDATALQICGTMADPQMLPQMVHGAQGDIVAWSIDNGVRYELADAGAQDLFVGPGSEFIAIAPTSTGFLAAYSVYTSAYAQLLSASGAKVGPPTHLTDSTYNVGVIDDGTGLSVYWVDNPFITDDLDASVPPGQGVWSSRLLADAGLGPAQLRYVAPDDLSEVRFAGSDAGQTLVAWANNSAGTLRGVRLAAGSGTLDATPLTFATSNDYFPGHSVASVGDGWVVVWSNSDAVRYRMVTATGVLEPITILADPHGNHSGFGPATAVAFDGETLLLAWLDYTSWWGDLFGTTLSLDGGVGATFAISSGGTSEHRQPVAVADGIGRWSVSYERFIGTAGVAARRAFTQTITVLPSTGSPCLLPGDCANGFCVDGVCCDMECGGSATTDCQACSVAAGAQTNGLCGPVAMGALCRPAAFTCDKAEVCDGMGLLCPPDVAQPDGVSCDGDAGACLASVCVLFDGGTLAPDAGLGEDAGVDSGVVTVSDAGTADAGVEMDGGAGGGGEQNPARALGLGCGCDGSPALAGLSVALFALAFRRRRR